MYAGSLAGKSRAQRIRRQFPYSYTDSDTSPLWPARTERFSLFFLEVLPVAPQISSKFQSCFGLVFALKCDKPYCFLLGK